MCGSLITSATFPSHGSLFYNATFLLSGMDEIDAYVIPDDKIDFNLYTIHTLWDINDEDELIELLGEENFE